MTIDAEKLRKDLKEACLGAFFGGGFGGALVEAADVERATPQELLKIAERMGVNLKKYQID